MLTTSTYHLVCQNRDRLQVKLAVEAIKEIFEGRAKTFKDHGIVIAFCSKPANGVNSIYCSITVNHRLTGPGKMVKLCLLFVGKFQIQKFDG
jgi:hypothetical protein